MSSVQPKLLKPLKLHSWAYPLTGKSIRCDLLAALLSHSHLNKAKHGRKFLSAKEENKQERRSGQNRLP